MVAAAEERGFLEYDFVSRSTMRRFSSLICFSRLACREIKSDQPLATIRERDLR